MHFPYLMAQSPDELSGLASTVMKVGGSLGVGVMLTLTALRLKLIVIGWTYTEALAYWQKRCDDLQADWQKRYDALLKERDGYVERLDRMGARAEAERQSAQAALMKFLDVNEKMHGVNERAVQTAVDLAATRAAGSAGSGPGVAG